MEAHRNKASWACCLFLTVTLGLLFAAIQVPSGWLIAALVSAGTTAICTGREIAPRKALLRPSQGCIGVLAAAPLAGVTTAKLSHYLGVSFACSGATLLLCLGCGFVLTRAVKTISPATALRPPSPVVRAGYLRWHRNWVSIIATWRCLSTFG